MVKCLRIIKFFVILPVNIEMKEFIFLIPPALLFWNICAYFFRIRCLRLSKKFLSATVWWLRSLTFYLPGEPDPRPQLVKILIGNVHYLHFSCFLWLITVGITVSVSLLTPPIPSHYVSRRLYGLLSLRVATCRYLLVLYCLSLWLKVKTFSELKYDGLIWVISIHVYSNLNCP